MRKKLLAALCAFTLIASPIYAEETTSSVSSVVSVEETGNIVQEKESSPGNRKEDSGKTDSALSANTDSVSSKPEKPAESKAVSSGVEKAESENSRAESAAEKQPDKKTVNTKEKESKATSAGEKTESVSTKSKTDSAAGVSESAAEKDSKTESGESGQGEVKELTPAPSSKTESKEETNPIDEYDVRDSIVRVMTVYEFQDGSWDEWTGGFGFLIAKDCVIIPRNAAVIERDSQLYRNIISQRLTVYQDRLGINLQDYTNIMANLHTYIVDGDNKIEATVNADAGGDSYAVLKLSSRINSKPAVTFSEAPISQGDILYAVGTESEEPMPPRIDFFGRQSKVTGMRKNGTSEYIDFEGSFTTLSAGCPLVDVEQKVVGFITDGDGGRGTAVNVRTIEKALDSANIEYETIAVKQADESMDSLLALLERASSVDRTLYTEESLAAVDAAAASAQTVANDVNASKNRIQKAMVPLENALAQLQEIDHTGDYVRYVVIFVVLIALVAAALMIPRIIANRNKEDWEREAEKEDRKEAKRKKKEEKKKHKKEKVSADESEKENLRKEIMNDFDDGEAETGVLNDGGETGVLKEKGAVAFLKNRDTDQVITINKDKFVIGKSADTDFRINNNSVSRKHCQILRRGDSFFVEDLKSTNKTHLDGTLLEPGDQVPIRDGQELLIADEKWRFIQSEDGE